ncbi:RelA/SpoT domain-containing protein [uncultured Comamonas sp.]|uniref:GTP pyrophosphokinase n=1 Tax=uncultured Comamonas sp. TaxID=114710 RepID=UPI0025E866EF|nr:RelA/SpoT domain-containing protein [uncultured Comamonas sp.]
MQPNRESIDSIWENNPDLIRKYLDLLPRHEKLCEEVQYILESKLSDAKIEIAHATSRAKTLQSYCEKIGRKSYSNPLKEITDLAGVRVVFLYLSDLEKIEKTIEDEFEVIEKENKLKNNDTEKFGYGALHYLVKIKQLHSGARYDDLRDLICEIQVKTILQDAWSIVAHHLSYKNENDVPKSLIRKLNALSGLFETADDQFESLRTARNQYIEDAEKEISKNNPKYFEQRINLDNLIAYIASKFPERRKCDAEEYSNLLHELISSGYNTLSELDESINKGLELALKEEVEDPPLNGESEPVGYLDIGIIRTALAISNEEYCVYKYGTNSTMYLNYH